MKFITMLSAAVLASSVQAADFDEVKCLAQNIYHEARGESLQGQMAVAEVTMNRVKSSRFPDTICEVVWQNKQFSWTHDGKSDKMKNENAKKLALQLAKAYAEGSLESFFTNGSTMYHADYANPAWDYSKLELSAVIDTHVFYVYN